MTRKDYVLLAEALKRARAASTWSVQRENGINAAVKYLSVALERDNDRFDPVRFREATHLGDQGYDYR